MSKLLILTRDFPGPGNRGVSLIRRLPEFGVEPIVLTTPSSDENTNGGLIEELRHVGVRIETVFAFERSPFRILRKCFGLHKPASWLEDFFFVPDFQIHWGLFALGRALELIHQDSIRAMMTISPPESMQLIGRAIKRRTNIQWLANFEDLWTSKSHLHQKPTKFHSRWVRRMEGSVYEEADLILANTEGNVQIYQDEFGVTREKIVLLHLGYDPEDHVERMDRSEPEVLRIGYLGTFTKVLFPWKEFLNCMQGVIHEGIPIRLEIVGHVGVEGQKFIQDMGMSAHVLLHGVTTHSEAMRKIGHCDAFLVLMYETPYSKAIVPHKLYHYLGMRKPILGIAEEKGEVDRILQKTGMGRIAPLNKRENLRQILKSLAHQKLKGDGWEFQPNEPEIKKYDMGEIAMKLAERIVGSKRAEKHGCGETSLAGSLS